MPLTKAVAAAAPLIAPHHARRDIPFARPLLGEEERAAVLAVLDSPVLVHGPREHEFEAAFAAYTGAPHAVAVASCTAAMHLAYFNFGIGAGDEVIVPAQTHTATAHAVELAGAKPVFVDSEARTGNIDIDQIEAAVTPRTRAIAVVHFLGVPVAMDRVMNIAGKHHLKVIEDCALSLGATYKGVHTGLWGDVGCFSFYPVKHMTTAEGGMLITRDAGTAERIRLQRAFGVDRTPSERTVPGMYDVTMLGFNYRMNELEAALGIAQLKKLPAWLTQRRANLATLRMRLQPMPGLHFFADQVDGVSSAYCLAAILSETQAVHRTDIMDQLKVHGVGTSVYYPAPVPHLTYYRTKYGYQPNSFMSAAAISAHSIALPVGPHVLASDIEYIANIFAATVEKYG